jgi:hypothetical protein
MTSFRVLACCVLGLLVGTAPRSSAANYFVTNLVDGGSGSLRHAILDANATPGADNIICTNLAGVILLGSALPPITDSATLRGPGTNYLTVHGSNSFRVFEFGSGTIDTIEGFTIANGQVTNVVSGGAGILNAGTLTVSKCLVVSNASYGSGGGILNHGALTINDSAFIENRSGGTLLLSSHYVTGPSQGGGIYTDGSLLSLSNTVFQTNAASGSSYIYFDSRGGALCAAGGRTVLVNCSLSGNRARGGTLYQDWTGEFTDGLSGRGGGIFAGNESIVLITNCTLAGNVAQGGAGSRYGNSGKFGGAGGYAYGGAIHSTGNVALVNCTLSGNSSRGGNGASAPDYGGNGGSGYGGAVYGPSGTFFALNCTVFSNTVVAGTAGTGFQQSGLPGSAYFAGLYTYSNSASLKNTILQTDNYQFTSLGNNLFEGTGIGGATDQSVTPLILSQLQDNGGCCSTHALPTNSPAIDAGASAGAPIFDTRNVQRPRGAGVDIGAYELQPSDPPLITHQSEDETFTVGTTNSLFVRAVGASALAFQWHLNGTNLPGATNSTLTFSPVSYAQVGSYRAVVSNSIASVTSAVVRLTAGHRLDLGFTGKFVNVYGVAARYLNDQTLTVFANPSTNLLQWLGDANGTNPAVTVKMDRARCLRALIAGYLRLKTNGNGSIFSELPNNLYVFGSSARFTAVPQPGNYFAQWVWPTATYFETNNPFYFTNDYSTELTATFAALNSNECALTVMVDGVGRVTRSSQGNRFPLNSIVTVTAIADANQSFLGWQGDLVSSQTNISLLLNTSKVVRATFTKRPNLSIDPCGCGLREDGFRFRLNGSFGNYDLQQASALTNWASLGIVSNAFGTLQFTDSAATNQRGRFYRAVLLP